MRRPYVVVGGLLLLCWFVVTVAKTQERNDSAFQAATVVESADAVYPANAVGSGTVVLAVSVDAEGEVREAKTVSGSGAFLDSALQAIKRWKFKPAALRDKAVPSVVPVAFSFGWPVACGK